MKKLKIMSILGTRPEAIKMAPLILEAQKNDLIESQLCVTSQHREMLDRVLDIFKLKPDFDLNIMAQSQTLTDITTKALVGMEDVFKREKPDLVLVHGDTTTTFAGALAAFYAKVPVGHVEAGLRSFDKYQPYPEEINRRLVSSLADLNFAPTGLARQNLLNEGVSDKTIYVTGNTAIDCFKYTLDENHVFTEDKLNHIDYASKKVIVMTAHRRENLGEPLENICRAVRKIVDDNAECELVYAVHPNPAVVKTAYRYLDKHERIHLIDPIDIPDMHNLIRRSYLVLTDSGGLQEEAPSCKKPVLVLRNVTERPEGVEAGTLKLAGVDYERIYSLTHTLLHDPDVYNNMISAKNPFGDGNASKRIIHGILRHFGLDDKPFEHY